jgi:hypothetical protein
MTTTKLFYNYAVVDQKYPGEPHYWGLSGFAFGNADSHGWSFEFAPGSTKTTELLTNNLKRKEGRITLAIPSGGIPTKEPKWTVGITYDQLLIRVDSDAGASRKIGLYRVRVLAIGKETDSHRHSIFKVPVKVMLCHVAGGGYVTQASKDPWGPEFEGPSRR